MITEKLRNCNGFFTTRRYYDKDKEFSFNFRQRREAFINTDTRRFKIQTSGMDTPPSLAGPLQGLKKLRK